MMARGARLGWALAIVLAAAAMHPTTALARPIATLVFLTRFEQIPEAPHGTLDVSRVPRLATPAAEKLLAPFVGREITQQNLNELRAVVQKYYAGIGRPFVAVTVPAQDVSDGVVRVIVVESRLDRIFVQGNHWFQTAEYRRAIRLTSGQPIDKTELDSDLDWINQSPYRHATVEANTGRRVGTTDLTIHAQDALPLAVYAGVDNTGTAATGLERISTGFDWGNAFARGDDLSYGYQTSADLYTVQQHQLSYTTAAPERGSFTVSGVYAITHAASGALVASTGLSQVLSVRYVQPLLTGGPHQQLSIGADEKGTNNNLLFGGVSIFPTRTQIYDIALGYGLSWKERSATTNADVSLVMSPGALSAANTNSAFAAQQAGAQANYAYANGGIQRLIQLRGGATLALHLQGQISDAILLPSEQLSFGGVGDLRGFPSSFATRDEGVLASAQLGARPFPLGFRDARTSRPIDRFAPYAFVDYGIGRNHQSLGGATNIQLLSAGPGFSYQAGKLVTARFDYGFAIWHIGAPQPSGAADLGIQVRT